MATTIDEEWDNFNSAVSNEDYISEDSEENLFEYLDDDEFVTADINNIISSETPKPTNIYISTRTKIAYLNNMIDLKDIFWKIPVMNYSTPKNGVIKKQMKFNSINIEELNFIQNKLKDELHFTEHIITSINNPSGRIKFKDIRKVSIGISKKDIMSYRCKQKSAFYNCFVIILRLRIDNLFKEFHVKVFNTGKLEIPGIQNEKAFNHILELVIETLQPHVSCKLGYKENSEETVLINSNFNCGFFINRQALYNILKTKYNIQAIYDPCSYPGIQCKFYYNPESSVETCLQIQSEIKEKSKDIKQLSFMIFRTGSVLIVGRCDEDVLMNIYEYLKNILMKEYKDIFQKISKSPSSEEELKEKTSAKKKIRRKTIMVDNVK
jgi:TATA-box binding protein (TBP) (component of TFIID and TFIIIB)